MVEKLALQLAPRILVHVAAILASLADNKKVNVDRSAGTNGTTRLDRADEVVSPLVEADVYDSVSDFAIHRRLSEKTIRNYLHILPHSTIGGIRIKRIEADRVLDGLEQPVRGRRKKNAKK